MSAWIEQMDPGSRCRKWKLRWTRGRGSERVSKSRVYIGGKRDAIAALKEYERECNLLPTEETPSFADYCIQWNDNRLRINAISKSTHDNYQYLLNGLSFHIDKRLEEVRAEDIENALAALREGHSPSGRVWGGTSLRTAYKVLKKMFDDAQARGSVLSNPCVSIKAPKADTQRRKALSLNDSAKLLAMLDIEDAHQFAMALMLRTGMRAGECLGVRWSDVSDAGISIRREVTKTDCGERIVPLDSAAKEMIRKRYDFISRYMGEAEDGLNGEECLCCTKDGRETTYNAMKHWWAKHAKDYNMEGWTLHELRHTYATNLAQANVHPSTMASLLGHSSSEITMEIYTHVHQEDMQKAVDALADARQNAASVHLDVHLINQTKNKGQSN